jgi:hypothetical protein
MQWHSMLRRALASAYVPPTFEDRLDKQFNKLVDFILAREPPASESPGDADTLFVPSGSLALLVCVCVCVCACRCVCRWCVCARPALASESPGDADTLFVPSGSLALVCVRAFTRAGQPFFDAVHARHVSTALPCVNMRCRVRVHVRRTASTPRAPTTRSSSPTLPSCPT